MNNRAKVIAIASLKGGSGKTSITSLLARYYAEVEGKQVLVIDFDSGAGLTSLLYDSHIKAEVPSIVEVLEDVMHYTNPYESYQQAIIQTRHQYDNSNQGSIYLLPSKPALDNLLVGTNRNLLKAAIDQLALPADYIVLIDSGPNAVNVSNAIKSADVVFIPFQFSRQDAFPVVETLTYVLHCQQEKNLPYLGGWVYIQDINTHWEKLYLANVQEVIKEFRYSNSIMCPNQNPFIQMKPSRVIHRGVHMTWSIRDELFDPIREMAAVIKKIEKFAVLES